MRRPLVIALVGLILISFLEWGINNEISHYSANQQTDQSQSPLLGGPVLLSLRDGIAWLWNWLRDNHDELLVIFTALLFGVTAYLVKYTRGLLIEAQKQFPHFKENVAATTTAAKAAKESADLARQAFLAAHRPRIRIKHVLLSKPIESGKPVTLDVAIVNSGDTDCRLIEFGVVIHAVPKGGIPLLEPFQERIPEVQFEFSQVESGRTLIFRDRSAGDLSSDEMQAIKDGESILHCFSYVDYVDTGEKPTGKKTSCHRMLVPAVSPGYDYYGGIFVKTEIPSEYEYQD